MLETSGAISYILSYILLQFPTDLVVGFDYLGPVHVTWLTTFLLVNLWAFGFNSILRVEMGKYP